MRSGLASGMAVLDLGCGSGDVTIDIAKAAGPEGRVVGIDLDEMELFHARRASADAGCSVEWKCFRAEKLEEEGVFDIAYARFLLSHLTNPRDVLLKMKRALKPRGRVVIEDIDIHHTTALFSAISSFMQKRDAGGVLIRVSGPVWRACLSR
jgi:ubiquinone/menaquinone biosynthesis C-methylase UbiE